VQGPRTEFGFPNRSHLVARPLPTGVERAGSRLPRNEFIELQQPQQGPARLRRCQQLPWTVATSDLLSLSPPTQVGRAGGRSVHGDIGWGLIPPSDRPDVLFISS